MPGMMGLGVVPGASMQNQAQEGTKARAATNAAEAAHNLLINYMPNTCDEAQLRELFSEMGPVETVNVVKDMQTQASRCFGFVTMVSAEHALRAIKEMNGREVGGKKLRVAYAQPHLLPGGVSPSVNVFISGFAGGFSEAALRGMAQRFGHIEEARLLDEAKHPRGVGFVRFSTVQEAETCVNTLNNTEIATPDGPGTLAVKFAERKRVKQALLSKQRHQQITPGGYNGGTGMPSNVIFVHGVGGATEREVLDLIYPSFGATAKIAKVDVPKGNNGEPRNFCFIHYANVRDAQRALSLDGHGLNGKTLQVRFK